MVTGRYIYFFLIFAFFISCDSTENSTDVHEGIITYDITYLQNELENIETNILPKKMILKFNDNYSLTQINGFMGLFGISLISDFENSKDITMVKFFDNKYVHYCDKNEQSSLFDYMKVEKIRNKNDSTKNYSGYEAKTARVYEEDKPPYTIFYTDEFGVSNPNRNNPFREVDGVLLEFQLQLLQLRMNLVAQQIEHKEIPDEAFEVSDEYTNISRESMILILNKMLETN